MNEITKRTIDDYKNYLDEEEKYYHTCIGVRSFDRRCFSALFAT